MNLRSLANAQKLNENQIDLDFQKLIELKVNYERYKGNKKGDSILKIYQGQINKIKESPNIYLNYIRITLKKNKSQLLTKSIAYKYITVVESNISLRKHLIKEIDLFRVIRYSLFKRKDSILPTDFRGLPVVDEKNYNGYDKAKDGEYKIASKFLLHNLLLTQEEVKFVKNCDNQAHILSIKKYLDIEGLNEENEKFIKWAIDYLIKSPEVTLGYLNNVYDVVRYQNQSPRDRNN
jgi:hypothetical protein